MVYGVMYKTAKKFAIHSQSNKHSESESSFRLTLPMSNQDRISPYNIKLTSNEIKKTLEHSRGLLLD